METLVAKETPAGMFTAVLVLWSYCVFAVRYPTSVALVGPLPTPVLSS